MDKIIYRVEYISADLSLSHRLTDNKPLLIPTRGDLATLETERGVFSGEVSHIDHWLGFSEEHGSAAHFTTVHLGEMGR